MSLHKDVRQDLNNIKVHDPDAHAKLIALIQQLQADINLHTKLTTHDFGKDQTEPISASKWLNVWKQGKDLWRLKSWELERQKIRYRIIYVYLVGQTRFVVMAIVKRDDFDYDDVNDPIRRRILTSLRSTYGIA